MQILQKLVLTICLVVFIGFVSFSAKAQEDPAAINEETAVAPTPLFRANPARLLYLQALDQIVQDDREASLKTLQYLIRRYPRAAYAIKAKGLVEAMQEEGSPSVLTIDKINSIIRMFDEEYLEKSTPTPEPTPVLTEIEALEKEDESLAKPILDTEPKEVVEAPVDDGVTEVLAMMEQAAAETKERPFTQPVQATGVLEDIMAMTEGIEQDDDSDDAPEEGTLVAAVVPHESGNRHGLTKSMIVGTIKQNWGRVRVCIGWSRQKNPNLTGKSVISFKIHPTGQVSDTTLVKSTVGDPSLDQCLMNRVSNMNFPEFEGEPKTITYPFVVTQ